MYGTFGPNLQYSQSQHKSPDTHYSLSHGTHSTRYKFKGHTTPTRGKRTTAMVAWLWFDHLSGTSHCGFTARMLDDKDRLRGTRTVNLELLYTYAGGTRDSLESRMSEHGLNAPRKELDGKRCSQMPLGLASAEYLLTFQPSSSTIQPCSHHPLYRLRSSSLAAPHPHQSIKPHHAARRRRA